MKQKMIRLEDEKMLSLNIFLAKNSISFQEIIEDYIDELLNLTEEQQKFIYKTKKD